jgi:hypothetical protein
MSPRVRLTQFFATACAMTTKPSVHMTKEVARRRSAGTPSGRATSAATSPANRKFRMKPVPKCIPSRAEA